ncbi:hypothetical protein QBC38DRAFT_440221 [Podospora fimiseda]|uniref:Uncharacterized protein n=1 Tax=Podospora fimiseda TaxID=252190 RepID=A0AAN7BY63_9PEZI|nr:hypothetical protein QBC38DRAFT_440221 [Podospora fimiseda]
MYRRSYSTSRSSVSSFDSNNSSPAPNRQPPFPVRGQGPPPFPPGSQRPPFQVPGQPSFPPPSQPRFPTSGQPFSGHPSPHRAVDGVYPGAMGGPNPRAAPGRARSNSVGCMRRHNFKYKGVLPVIGAFLTFFLSMLAFWAGQKPGDLNGVHLLRINTSTIPSDDDIQFSSIHVMSICTGKYEPDAQSIIAEAVPTQCHTGFAVIEWDIVDMIRNGGDLLGSSQPSPFTTSPDPKPKPSDSNSTPHRPIIDRDISYEAYDGLHDFSKEISVICYFLIIGVISTALSLGFSLAAILKPVDELNEKHAHTCGAKSWTYLNCFLAILKFFCLLVPAVMVTFRARVTVDQINGRDDAIYAVMGQKCYGIMGVATSIAALELGWWVDKVMVVNDIAWCTPGRRQHVLEKRSKKDMWKGQGGGGGVVGMQPGGQQGMMYR